MTVVENNIALEALAAEGTDAGDAIIQVDKALSIMNHRLYRQGRNYTCSLQLIPQVDHDALELEIYTLPDNWFVRGAIKHAYKTWRNSIQDELAAGAKLSRWYDFRINEQDPDSTWDFLSPAVFDGDSYSTLSPDEYTETAVTGEDLSVEAFHVMGTVSDSFNIFAEYAKLLNSRKVVAPAVDSDESYAGLTPGGEDQVHLTETGDQPPYDYDFGTNWNTGDILVLRDKLQTRPTNSGKSVSRQFVAPLGMIYVRLQTNDSDTDFSVSAPSLILRCKPGSYKGVAAESLTG